MKPAIPMLALLLLAQPVTAEQEERQAEETSLTEPETTPAPDDSTPAVENPANPDQDETFRIFQPSEDISADTAVPFPVDI